MGGRVIGNLYIIGNGFDLNLGLKTKPNDFIEYLKNQSIYNKINNAQEVLNYYGVDWNEYEQSLCYIDLDEVEFQNEIQPNYISDREYDRDGGILNMQIFTESINTAINMALTTMIKTANYDALNLSKKYPRKQLFGSKDAILTFDYTSTIEYLFELPPTVPLFHIHGCLNQNSPLIFGYRRNKDSYSDEWNTVIEEEWDYYIHEQREILLDFYKKWEKKPKLNNLKFILNNCTNINKVIVLGHSMSIVDADYMELIEQQLNPLSWEISYYKPSDIDKITSCGYSFQNKIRFSKINELMKKQ